jgi:hypothetical protein
MQVKVVRSVEANQGVSYWLTLVNDRGETITPHNYYEKDYAEPLEALARCHSEAISYASFFGVEPEPYIHDGAVYVGHHDDLAQRYGEA